MCVYIEWGWVDGGEIRIERKEDIERERCVGVCIERLNVLGARKKFLFKSPAPAAIIIQHSTGDAVI